MKSLRWAVSLSETLNAPNFEQIFRRCVVCAPEEDVENQRAFMYRQDSLACLIGRILSRKAASICLGKSWNELEFDRTNKGKPFLKGEYGEKFNFNVSHQGDMVVLATSENLIGVDVMKIDQQRSESAIEHIEKLKRQFTDQELEMMKGQINELDRWRAFYRVWCLKEAILKATGIGLTDNLRKYDFRVDSRNDFEPGCFLRSTKYFHETVLKNEWSIEESFIGEYHCVAVAERVGLCNGNSGDRDETRFEMKTVDFLLEDAGYLNISPDFDDIEELELFLLKPNKHF